VSHKKLTPATLPKVTEAILKMNARDRRVVCNALNAALDELAAEDAFGTEMQNDPRGDQRG
jgi:hypothetical protein